MSSGGKATRMQVPTGSTFRPRASSARATASKIAMVRSTERQANFNTALALRARPNVRYSEVLSHICHRPGPDQIVHGAAGQFLLRHFGLV